MTLSSLELQQISEFRKHLPDHYRAARQGQPVAVTQRNDDGIAFLLQDNMVEQMLQGVHFSPQVYREGDQVGFWLPELELYALGDDLESAEDDLLEEVREYVAEYFSNPDIYAQAPGRREHLLHLLKAYVADLRGELASVISARQPA